jgi:septal ring factor EnvC (AmiA/AmiB activator)
MNNLTLDSLVDLYDAKCVEHEKLPIETNANREKADIFYRDHVVRLSKEIARLRAELEQQQSQQPTLDTQRNQFETQRNQFETQRNQFETQRNQFEADTRRLEKQRDEIGNSTKVEWQTLDRQIFSRYKY